MSAYRRRQVTVQLEVLMRRAERDFPGTAVEVADPVGRTRRA